MNNYKELKIWQKSIELSVKIYHITQTFPRTEVFGLTSQMRRSASSVATNIAEGAGRNSRKEFSNFLGIANGSSSELETQMIIASKVNLISNAELKSLQKLVTEIQKMNWALKRTLLRTSPSSTNTQDWSTNNQYSGLRTQDSGLRTQDSGLSAED
ncbi:four helix bundle protein [Chryseolinea sp. T2]|uniref:four helix bundle protein n=1 Tax=Chryseolinea sp. T2 TaxID=3129255 RepID=UPI003076FA24